jgi:hypothetical protein
MLGGSRVSRAAALLLALVVLCTACTNVKPIDISDPSLQPAILCDLATKTATNDVARLAPREILVYPNRDLKALQIARTGEYEMTPICENVDLCDIQRSDGAISIVIRPDLKHHPEMMGFKTIYRFDQVNRTLTYTSGGGLDSAPEHPALYVCKASPRVVKQ